MVPPWPPFSPGRPVPPQATRATGATGLERQRGIPAGPSLASRRPLLAGRAGDAGCHGREASEISAGDGEARRRLEADHRDRAVGAVESIGEDYEVATLDGECPVDSHLPRGDEDIARRESFQTQPGLEGVVEHDRVAKIGPSVSHDGPPNPLV